MRDHKRLRQVAIGVGMMVAPVLLLLIYAMSWVVLSLASTLNYQWLNDVVLPWQIRMGIPVLVTSSVLAVIGPCFCLAAPRAVKGTGFVLAMVFFSALGLLLQALQYVVSLPVWLEFAHLGFYCAILLCFLLFARKLSQYLEREDIRKLAQSAIVLFLVAGIALASLFGASGLMHVIPPRSLLAISILSQLILAIAIILAMLRYLFTLIRLRSALANPLPIGESRSGETLALITLSKYQVGIVLGLFLGLAGGYFVAPVRARGLGLGLWVLYGSATGAVAISLFIWVAHQTRKIWNSWPFGLGILGMPLGVSCGLALMPVLGWFPLVLLTVLVIGGVIGVAVGLKISAVSKQQEDQGLPGYFPIKRLGGLGIGATSSLAGLLLLVVFSVIAYSRHEGRVSKVDRYNSATHSPRSSDSSELTKHEAELFAKLSEYNATVGSVVAPETSISTTKPLRIKSGDGPAWSGDGTRLYYDTLGSEGFVLNTVDLQAVRDNAAELSNIEETIKARRLELAGRELRLEDLRLDADIDSLSEAELIVHRTLDELTHITTPLDAWISPALGVQKSSANLMNGYIIDEPLEIGSGEAFSYGCWVQPTSPPTFALLSNRDGDKGHRGFDLTYEADGLIQVILAGDASNSPGYSQSYLAVHAAADIAQRVWSHVFVTVDGTGRAAGVQIYVNGKPASMRIVQDKLQGVMKSETSLLIGSRFRRLNFKGQIDDVRIYKRKLSASEVHRLYLAGVIAVGELPNDQRTDVYQKTLEAFYDRHDPVLLSQLDEQEATLVKGVTRLIVNAKCPAASPHSNSLVAFGRRPSDKSKPESDEIWMLDMETREARLLAQGRWPRWSNDGKKLYFQSPSKNRMMWLDVDGDEPSPTSLTDFDVFDVNAAVSPDGSLVVQVQNHILQITRIEDQAVIYRFDCHEPCVFAWSANSEYVAFGPYRRNSMVGVWLIDVQGKQQRQLLASPYSSPAFSNDARNLAVHHAETGEIHIYNLPEKLSLLFE